MTDYCIIDKGTTCALNFRGLATASNFPLPIQADDALHLITAAFKSPDSEPRAELHGVIADRMTFGVRVRVVAQPGHFDIPWEVIARGLETRTLA